VPTRVGLARTWGNHRVADPRLGRLTTIDSPLDDLFLDYDELGRTERELRIINGTTYTVTKFWDAGG
jgi:hypothetical protein